MICNMPSWSVVALAKVIGGISNRTAGQAANTTTDTSALALCSRLNGATRYFAGRVRYGQCYSMQNPSGMVIDRSAIYGQISHRHAMTP